jgi:hypothetical protein
MSEVSSDKKWPLRVWEYVQTGPGGFAVLTFLVSIFGTWQSCRAQRLAAMAEAPAISVKAELVQQLQAGRPMQLKLTLTNNGRTPARKLMPYLMWNVVGRGAPFNPTFLDSFGHTAQIDVSELNSGEQRSFSPKVEPAYLPGSDVLKGTSVFYIYGKAGYTNNDGDSCELHFCRYYEFGAEIEPLTLRFCPSYNETIGDKCGGALID